MRHANRRAASAERCCGCCVSEGSVQLEDGDGGANGSRGVMVASVSGDDDEATVVVEGAARKGDSNGVMEEEAVL